MAIERNKRVLVTKDGDYSRRERVIEYQLSTRHVIISRIKQLITLLIYILFSDSGDIRLATRYEQHS